jgi:hypothetical protein
MQNIILEGCQGQSPTTTIPTITNTTKATSATKN